MKKLDQFILKSFVGPFLAVLGIVVFILVMQFLWLYIDELVGKGLEFKVILEFLMWGSCQVLPLAIPLATLLSSMMTLGDMGEKFELTAIKASGISLTRVLVPMMLVSVLISIGAFYIGDRLVPYSINQIYTMRDDIRRTKSEIKIPTGTFYDGIDGYILRIEDRDKETGMMYNIQVYDHTATKGNTRITVADSGIIKMSKVKDYLTFTLYDGVSYQEDNKRKFRDTTLALQRVAFSREEMVISLQNYTYQQSDSARYGEQVRSMNLKALHNGHDSLMTLVNNGTRKHVEEFLRQSVIDYRKQLDTNWRERSSVMKPHPDGPWKDATEKKRAYDNAAGGARQYASTARNQIMESADYTRLIYRTNVEIWKKYAQALACLLLFFIGAPIGALLKKGGLGTPAIVSLLFFVLYWVIDITGERLANNGTTTAFIGKFISAFILAPIGGFLTVKAVQDASLLNLDLFKSWFRKIKSQFIRMFRKTRIVYMGTPEFSVGPLDALLKAGYKVVGVVTVPDKPSGRGLKMNESAVKKYAVEKGLPLLQPEKLKDEDFLKSLAAWKADLFVVVGFRMLPEVVWSMPKLGTFNLHAALLPQYRGAAPINWAVINGENISGVTTFMIDHKIDTGGIILRSECHIEPTDTAGDLHDKLMELGSTLVVETVEGLIQKNVELRVQRSFIQGSELLKPAPKLTRELQHIDWNDTTRHIYNLIRGLSPFPCAFTELVPMALSEGNALPSANNGADATGSASPSGMQPVQLKIYFGEMRTDLHAAPGTVLSDGKTYLAIATQDGAIAITDLQLAGKKRMDVKSFLLGFRNPTAYTTTQGTSKAEMEKAKPKEED
ncbi:MAG: methionyl-tRNA formyltransferase [Bacteroidales bacterium]|nr:methionyl-tRNA formyltransferase [Bacteroidales bacterium]